LRARLGAHRLKARLGVHRLKACATTEGLCHGGIVAV